MLLLRVELPDRPGALGTVASAIGMAGADIQAVEIVDKGEGFVVDDFMLAMPAGGLADQLVSVCNELDGVRVLWISRYPEGWGIEGDIELLNQMTLDMSRAGAVLVERAPTVFRCQWAVLVDAAGTRVLAASAQAPDLVDGLARFGDLDSTHRVDLPPGWELNWGETTCAVAPVRGGRAIILGRLGGPEFLASELRRLQHLGALA